jgi:hypothetical protein
MKLLIVFLILVGILVFAQAERNDCQWFGLGGIDQWASCLLKG